MFVYIPHNHGRKVHHFWQSLAGRTTARNRSILVPIRFYEIAEHNTTRNLEKGKYSVADLRFRARCRARGSVGAKNASQTLCPNLATQTLNRKTQRRTQQSSVLEPLASRDYNDRCRFGYSEDVELLDAIFGLWGYGVLSFVVLSHLFRFSCPQIQMLRALRPEIQSHSRGW